MKQSLEGMINNENYKLLWTFPYMDGGIVKYDTLKGWANDEFATQLSANYESLFGTGLVGNKTMAQIQYMKDALPDWAIIDKLFGTKGAMRVRSVHQTMEFWSGSSSPDWSISFVIPRLRMSEAPVPYRVRNVQKSVMAEEVDKTRITFPWNPTREMANNPHAVPEGSASLEIGKWLAIRGLLTTSVNVTFSKEVTKDGTPLFATVSIGMRPWREQFASDVDTWYQGV